MIGLIAFVQLTDTPLMFVGGNTLRLACQVAQLTSDQLIAALGEFLSPVLEK